MRRARERGLANVLPPTATRGTAVRRRRPSTRPTSSRCSARSPTRRPALRELAPRPQAGRTPRRRRAVRRPAHGHRRGAARARGAAGLRFERRVGGRSASSPASRAVNGAPDPLHVGLIGYGLAGAVFHAPLISAIDGLEVASVVTSDPERRARAEADLPGVRVLDHAEALWELAGEHDLVVVASPNRTHVPLARAAVGAGLPVVVDKPLAPTAADGRALVGGRLRGRRAAHGVPQPPLGRRHAHRPASARGGRRRRGDALRVAVRALAALRAAGGVARARRPRGGGRAALRPRRPPGRSGPAPVRAPHARLRRGRASASAPPSTTTPSSHSRTATECAATCG